MKKLILLSTILVAVVAFTVMNRGFSGSEVKLIGIYEYVYEYNSDEWNENHYMEFKKLDGKQHGTYYGTSDDFDDAREGYPPGFYKQTMENIVITDTSVSFDLRVSNNQMLTKQVTPLKETSNNSAWGRGGEKILRHYSCQIKDDTITMETAYGPRVFSKLD